MQWLSHILSNNFSRGLKTYLTQKGHFLQTCCLLCIFAVIRGVQETQKQQRESKLRGTYAKFSDEQKAEIARCALQNGNNVKYFNKKLEKLIKESIVRMWISKYKSEYEKRKAGVT